MYQTRYSQTMTFSTRREGDKGACANVREALASHITGRARSNICIGDLFMRKVLNANFGVPGFGIRVKIFEVEHNGYEREVYEGVGDASYGQLRIFAHVKREDGAETGPIVDFDI